MSTVLAGDVGGTNTRLALFAVDGDRLSLQHQQTHPSREFDSLDAVVERYLAAAAELCGRACFAIAGPVTGRRAVTTNLPWEIDANEMQDRLGIERVRLLNDLEATAWGIGELAEDDLHTLYAGRDDATGNRTVIAAGTGLGEAGLHWDGTRHRPFATEGGHTDFAPSSPLETALREHLAERFGHVSWERVVSGPGLVNLHRFLSDRHGEAAAGFGTGASEDDAAAAVVAAARAGDALSREAVELFVHLYGAEAGNLALKHMATGGVFVAGGIAPKILDFLEPPTFVEAFLAKGRMRPLLERMSVRVVLDDLAALRGAARAALEQEVHR